MNCFIYDRSSADNEKETNRKDVIECTSNSEEIRNEDEKTEFNAINVLLERLS